MNIRVFTPDNYPAIVNIHNSLNIVWPEKLEPRKSGQRLNGTQPQVPALGRYKHMET